MQKSNSPIVDSIGQNNRPIWQQSRLFGFRCHLNDLMDIGPTTHEPIQYYVHNLAAPPPRVMSRHILTLDHGYYHPSMTTGDGHGRTELPWHAPQRSLSINSQDPTDWTVSSAVTACGRLIPSPSHPSHQSEYAQITTVRWKHVFELWTDAFNDRKYYRQKLSDKQLTIANHQTHATSLPVT